MSKSTSVVRSVVSRCWSGKPEQVEKNVAERLALIDYLDALTLDGMPFFRNVILAVVVPRDCGETAEALRAAVGDRASVIEVGGFGSSITLNQVYDHEVFRHLDADWTWTLTFAAAKSRLQAEALSRIAEAERIVWQERPAGVISLGTGAADPRDRRVMSGIYHDNGCAGLHRDLCVPNAYSPLPGLYAQPGVPKWSIKRGNKQRLFSAGEEITLRRPDHAFIPIPANEAYDISREHPDRIAHWEGIAAFKDFRAVHWAVLSNMWPEVLARPKLVPPQYRTEAWSSEVSFDGMGAYMFTG